MLSVPQMTACAAERLVDGEDRRQRLDADRARAAAPPRAAGDRVGEQDDRLFGMVDDVVGEVGLVVDDQRDPVVAGDVGGRDDGELVPGDRRDRTRCRGCGRAATWLRTVVPCSMPGSVMSST